MLYSHPCYVANDLVVTSRGLKCLFSPQFVDIFFIWQSLSSSLWMSHTACQHKVTVLSCSSASFCQFIQTLRPPLLSWSQNITDPYLCPWNQTDWQEATGQPSTGKGVSVAMTIGYHYLSLMLIIMTVQPHRHFNKIAVQLQLFRVFTKAHVRFQHGWKHLLTLTPDRCELEMSSPGVTESICNI